jgi:hypothetical protein
MGSMAMKTSSLVKANAGYTNPGKDSKFTFHVTVTDTNGVEESQGDSTYTVLNGSMDFEGKTDVIQVLSPGGDTSYYKVESNGNVSQYFEPFDLDINQQGVNLPVFHVRGQWVSVPVGTHATENITLYDSTVTGTAIQQGIPIPIEARLLLTSVSTYSGSEDLDGGKLKAERTSSTSVGRVTVSAFGNPVQDASQTQVTTMWFVPKSCGSMARRSRALQHRSQRAQAQRPKC